MKTLVVYYSQARGNTKRIADMIVEETGFDAVRIDTVVPYTGTYEEIVDQGQDEVERKFKPEIKPIEVDFSTYGRFIIMTPTWWYTMAPSVLTFLSGHDFSGKHLVFVQTHGGWPGHVMKDICLCSICPIPLEVTVVLCITKRGARPGTVWLPMIRQ